MTTDGPDAPPELSDIEKARYRAALTARQDLHTALDTGDAGLQRAAAGQFQQAISQLDPDATRDKLHLPDDAGEHEDALRAILLRIPDGWGRWLSLGAGWWPLIIDLDRRLAVIDPAYVVLQCKEKFGGLRYYARTSDGLDPAGRTHFRELIEQAQDRSWRICEQCSGEGMLHASSSSYLQTLCQHCANTKGYNPVGETVDTLGPEHTGLWKITTSDGHQHYWDARRRPNDSWPAVGQTFQKGVVVEIKRVR